MGGSARAARRVGCRRGSSSSQTGHLVSGTETRVAAECSSLASLFAGNGDNPWMSEPFSVQAARNRLLAEFRWCDGHADMWRVFRDRTALAALIDALAQPWLTVGVTHVVGVEARGFLLGGAVAVRLGAGFHAVRKRGGLLPGPKLSRLTALSDYRGNRHELRIQATLVAGDVVLMVDDWAETGSQAMAVRELVELAGAQFAGVSLAVDQLDPEIRDQLGRVTTLVRADELEPC